MDRETNKKEHLKKDGALHPHPEKVKSELLNKSDFFDADDLVQMKYEMLRSVNTHELSITDAARTFGLSRVAFYRAQREYQHDGITGLLPRKRGPKNAHKLSDAVLGFVREHLAVQPKSPDWQQLSERVECQFGIIVHPRSIERAIKQYKKKGAL